MTDEKKYVGAVVTMYGGPCHGEKYFVPERTAWINKDSGHYARCGGKNNEMFWHNFPAPFGQIQNGILRPVIHVKHNT
jgi:hypothetical protein